MESTVPWISGNIEWIVMSYALTTFGHSIRRYIVMCLFTISFTLYGHIFVSYLDTEVVALPDRGRRVKFCYRKFGTANVVSLNNIAMLVRSV